MKLYTIQGKIAFITLCTIGVGMVTKISVYTQPFSPCTHLTDLEFMQIWAVIALYHH